MDFDDIVKIVDQVKVLEARIAVAEAERDAATKKAEQLLLSRYFTRCREGAFDHSTDCATWGDDGQGNVDGKPVHPPCNCGASWNWAKQMEAERDAAQKRVQDCETRMMRYAIQLGEMQAERDAARAGEARAVEALKRCHEGAARQLAEPRDHNDDQYALTAIATECDAVLAAQSPALDWLAQQRREAVAAWIEKEATKCRKQYGEYYDRSVDCMLREAAALRAGEVGNE